MKYSNIENALFGLHNLHRKGLRAIYYEDMGVGEHLEDNLNLAEKLS